MKSELSDSGTQQRRILREREVTEITGLSRCTIWRLEQRGVFPRRRRLTPGAVGWWADEVMGWVASREQVMAKPIMGESLKRGERL